MTTKSEDICWYHGKISREDSERLLKDGKMKLYDIFNCLRLVFIGSRPDGSFLVRESNSSTGDFVLSVLNSQQVIHFQIRRHREDAFFSIGK